MPDVVTNLGIGGGRGPDLVGSFDIILLALGGFFGLKFCLLIWIMKGEVTVVVVAIGYALATCDCTAVSSVLVSVGGGMHADRMSGSVGYVAVTSDVRLDVYSAGTDCDLDVSVSVVDWSVVPGDWAWSP